MLVSGNKLGVKRSTRMIILGSGFAGVEVLKKVQKEYRNDDSKEIIMISKDNFLLFTPMLPEVATGTVDTRHIVTPIRSFCKKAMFYEATVQSIDLKNKKIVATHEIGKSNLPSDIREHILSYDYLIIALGSENNFFGVDGIEQNALKMKSIADASILRNHLIEILEQAHVEQDDNDLKRGLLTFVVVGGGFNGIETVGELADFIKDTVKVYYKNISMSEVRILLVNSSDKILKQVDEGLGQFALKKLKEMGVEFIMNTHVVGATSNSVKLDNGITIPCYTLVWSAGVTTSDLIKNLECRHDAEHRIITNDYLELPEFPGVYALGDCASITDHHTGRPYPQTAQHAIREGKVVAYNIISTIDGNGSKKMKFNYKTKGMMADIGKRGGVAIIYGVKLHGIIAWWIWRSYYLVNMPTISKKLEVMIDWTSHQFFKRDVAMIKRVIKDTPRSSVSKTSINQDKVVRGSTTVT
jgi:NADH:ubiquinone reductase (H+-translocating)